MASHARLLFAQRENSCIVRSGHASDCSWLLPSTLRLILLFGIRPIPITFVRFVLIADVAMGAAIYYALARWRSLWLLSSISSCGAPLDAKNPFMARLVLLAPDWL